MTKEAEKEAIAALRSLALDRNVSVKVSAAQGLARYVHNPDAVSALRSLSLDRNVQVKSAAAKALGGKT